MKEKTKKIAVYKVEENLNEIADALPIVFDWDGEESVPMTGAELNLTPYGDKYQLKPEKMYMIPVPVLRGVDHRKAVRDAFKSGGMAQVRKYSMEVMQMINS